MKCRRTCVPTFGSLDSATKPPKRSIARFNIGMHYAALRDQARSLAAFRALLDHNPGRAAEIAEFFLHSPLTRACIDQQPGFAEALVQTCPELFRATPPAPMDAERPDEEDNP